MFEGLCAFPLTPMAGEQIDLDAVERLVARASEAGASSIGALGSTGNYAYLNREERRQVLTASVEAAGHTPLIAGVGALRTRDVLQYAEDAQSAGAAALLLAPMSYQRLTDREVFELYRQVAENSSVPLIVYDNPGTTGFTFSDELHARIAQLDPILGVKIPPPAPGTAAERLAALRAELPEDYGIGISGDWMAAEALLAGCDTWYSVFGGVLPARALEITRLALEKDRTGVENASAELEPVWDLFRRHGSLRVVSALAEELGLAVRPSLPLPLQGLDDEARRALRAAMGQSGILDETR